MPRGFQPAVVGEEDDDRVVLQAVGAQLLEHPADAAVHAGDRVQIARPLLRARRDDRDSRAAA